MNDGYMASALLYVHSVISQACFATFASASHGVRPFHTMCRGMVTSGDTSAPLGRSETSIALQSLLIEGFGKSNVGALNLTDGVAFPWTRFLKNNVMCKEYVGPGIRRVYAARWYEDAKPVLVICRADGSYVELTPSKSGDRHLMHDEAGDAWQQIEALQQAKYIGVGWMHVRGDTTL